jgi:glycosyltransferase involved in cell wall biosynthesis
MSNETDCGRLSTDLAALGALAVVPAAQADGVALMRPHRYAVIPTHNRPDDLAALVRAIGPQCDTIIIVDNASTPAVGVEVGLIHPSTSVAVLRDDEQPPNLSRLWNVGFDWCAEHACNCHGHWYGGEHVADCPLRTGYDVAVFNDDAVVPAGWYDRVATGLRGWGPEVDTPAVCHTHTYGDENRAPAFRFEGDPMELMERMCPWAFVVRGELGLRADERIRWWWQDTDFELRARAAGGVLAVPGPQVINSKANSTTVGVLAEQAGRDRETFKAIHGGLPW